MTFSFVKDNATNFVAGYNTPNPASDNIWAMNNAHKAAVRQALNEWSNVADLTFLEIEEAGDIVGTMRFGLRTTHSVEQPMPLAGPLVLAAQPRLVMSGYILRMV